MRELGSPAPAFLLPGTDGRQYTLNDFSGAQGLLVAFICNHCPFVLHMLSGLVEFASEYATRGIATVALSSNDVAAYPEDSPLRMEELARTHKFGFPYLYDEQQEAALAFGAVCTPDLFLFDRSRKLFYRGRFDASRPRTQHTSAIAVAVTGHDLRGASDELLAGREAPREQHPSMGCSIKWLAGNDPDWHRGDPPVTGR